MLEREVENLLEQDLLDCGWILDVGNKNRNVYRQEPRTIEEKKKLKNKFPDFILYDSTTSSHPIAIIETKRTEHKTLENAKKQGLEYAEKLNAKFLFLYNVNRYIAYDVKTQKNLLINKIEVNSMLSLKELKKFKKNELNTQNTLQINTKNELIEVFKQANNKLREAGITAGISRFTEFSNLLFLKLISELNESMNFNLPKSVLWNSYYNFKGDSLLNYINHTVVPSLNNKFSSSESDPLFSVLKISDTSKLESIVDSLNSLNLSAISTDIKGDAFEYFIQKYNSTNNDLGEYFTPRHLVSFLTDILNPQFGEKIYDPFSGTGGMLITMFNKVKENLLSKNLLDKENLNILRKQTIWGGEISDNARIAKMNMILTGDGHSNIKKQDSFSNPVNNKFDVVISNIPFNQDASDFQASLYKPVIKNGNAIALEHIIASLKQNSSNSRAAVIVPEIVLNAPNLQPLRRSLIEKGILKGIISLPSKVFLPYTEAKTSILILSGKTTSIPDDIFIFKVSNDGYTLTTRRRAIPGINDLDEFLSLHNEMVESKYHNKLEHDNLVYISRNKILKNTNNSLLFFKYDSNIKDGWIKLQDILEQKKILNSKLYPTASIAKSSFWGMPLGEELWGDNFFSVTSNDTSRYSVVEQGMISFNPSRANVGSFGINISKEPMAVSSAYPTFKIKNKSYNPYYVYWQLTHNTAVMEQISDRCSGTVRQALNADDFLNIQIPIEDIKIQNSFTKELMNEFEQYKNIERHLFERFI